MSGVRVVCVLMTGRCIVPPVLPRGRIGGVRGECGEEGGHREVIGSHARGECGLAYRCGAESQGLCGGGVVEASADVAGAQARGDFPRVRAEEVAHEDVRDERAEDGTDGGDGEGDEDDAGATRAGAGEVGAQEREHHGEGHDRGPHRVVRGGGGREDADRRQKHSRAHREEGGGDGRPEGRAFLRELRAGRARRQKGQDGRVGERGGPDRESGPTRTRGEMDHARTHGARSSPPSAREDRSARTAAREDRSARTAARGRARERRRRRRGRRRGPHYLGLRPGGSASPSAGTRFGTSAATHHDVRSKERRRVFRRDFSEGHAGGGVTPRRPSTMAAACPSHRSGYVIALLCAACCFFDGAHPGTLSRVDRC